MNQRVIKLRQKLAEAGLDALLVSQPENRRYLSGFTGSAGMLLITQDKAVIATDFRYVEQSTQQAPDFELFKTEGDLGHWFPDAAGDFGARVWGYESQHLTVAEFYALKGAMRRTSANGRPRLVATREMVEPLRQVKEPQELALMARACEITSRTLDEVAAVLEPGTTEAAAAWEIERRFHEKGGQGLAFDSIVAAGPNAALPHHQPSDHPIERGETIVVDIGARVGGYCCDMTRTVCLGKPDDKVRRVYDTVFGAQLTALSTVRAGMTGAEADALARGFIKKAGYGEAFGHSLGHGVGLAVHELPRLSHVSQDVLEEGMVFTIEPGVYLAGWGGVRIEDTVVLEKGGARPLTTARKGLG
ncbi:MAG: aminopeptidase P family protein [Chloroflexi bacterium]|nr:aminopeptidase P family protein [Chloroflexota bacterium]